MKKIVLVAAAALCSASVFAGTHAQGTHFSLGAGVSSGMAVLDGPVAIGANIGLIGPSFEAKIGFNHSSTTIKSAGTKSDATATGVYAALAYRQAISSNTYWTAGVASEMDLNDDLDHAYSIAPSVGVEFAPSNNVLVDASIYPVRYSSVEFDTTSKIEANTFSFGGASLGVSYLF